MGGSLSVAGSRFLVAAILLSASVLAAGQRKEVLPAPLPTEIVTAKKVFISNGGEDPPFTGLGLRRSYNQFYAALKGWGHFELVGSPSESDAVLEIRLASQLARYGNDLQILPVLKLAILDPKTHTTLWVFTEELEAGKFYVVGGHQDEKFDKAMDRIVEDVKGLIGQTSPTSPAKP